MTSSVFCTGCGVRVAAGMKFCPGCGQALRGPASEVSNRSDWYRRPEFMVGAAFLLVIGFIWFYPSGIRGGVTSSEAGSAPVQTRAPLAYSDSRVLMIASQFICPCGQCTDDLASTCDCGMPRGGDEVRAFIAGELRSGRSAAEITEKVKQRYGAGYFVGARLL